jgi:hypothetical protein
MKENNPKQLIAPLATAFKSVLSDVANNGM